MALIDLSRQTTLDVEVDHTLVVSGIIDVVNSGLFNIVQNALQINGQPVVLTAGEMNYLQGATSNVQTQLNNLTTSVSGIGTVSSWFENIINKSGSRQDFNTCVFNNVNIPSDFHTGGTADNISQWLLFVNGQLVEADAITSIENSGNNVIVNVNTSILGFVFRIRHDFVLWGPLVTA